MQFNQLFLRTGMNPVFVFPQLHPLLLIDWFEKEKWNI
jgi:hypothetical protein